MSAKSPIIKFSPFEALLIGEKNNVIKLQPMKNTIFVSRISRKRKSLTLKDLFDVEPDSAGLGKEDSIFKVPQRVREYLKSKKLKSSIDCCKKPDLLYVNFKRHKTMMKSNFAPKSKSKNSKLKANKIKFKKKCTSNNNKFHAQVARKFQSYDIRKKCNNGRYRKILSKIIKNDLKKNKSQRNRHLLRDERGRFISRNELESRTSNKKQYFSNYLHQLYLERKEKNKFFHNRAKCKSGNQNKDVSKTNSFEQLEMQPKNTHKTAVSSESKVDKLLDKEIAPENMHDFVFPNCPAELTFCDFDDDGHLMDVVYENFPIVKFETSDTIEDFNESLRNAELLPQEKRLKIYKKKKSGIINTEKLSVIFQKSIPYLQIRKLENTQSVPYSFKNGKNGFSSVIDEPLSRKNHLITTKSFECVFLRSVEGKDFLLSNLVKPFWQN